MHVRTCQVSGQGKQFNLCGVSRSTINPGGMGGLDMMSNRQPIRCRLWKILPKCCSSCRAVGVQKPVFDVTARTFAGFDEIVAAVSHSHKCRRRFFGRSTDTNVDDRLQNDRLLIAPGARSCTAKRSRTVAPHRESFESGVLQRHIQAAATYSRKLRRRFFLSKDVRGGV